MNENDFLRQYWEHITEGDTHKITWEEASKNTEAVLSMKKSFGFAMFRASLSFRAAISIMVDSFLDNIRMTKK